MMSCSGGVTICLLKYASGNLALVSHWPKRFHLSFSQKQLQQHRCSVGVVLGPLRVLCIQRQILRARALLQEQQDAI